MMNIIWVTMIVTGLFMGMLTGNAGLLIESMTKGCSEAVTLCIGLMGAYMLWMGIMEVAKDAGVIDKLAHFIYPAMQKLFPNTKKAIAPITLNMAANFFGMGSAATPFGIEAMQIMQKENPRKDVASNEMCMFIALNASALELLPTTVLAMRTSAGSMEPYSVVLPIAIASLAAFAAAITVCRAFELKEKRYAKTAR